jgi:hypothetical protein
MFWSLQDQHAPSHTAGPWRSQNGTWPWLAPTNQYIFIIYFVYLFIYLCLIFLSFGAALIKLVYLSFPTLKLTRVKYGYTP